MDLGAFGRNDSLDLFGTSLIDNYAYARQHVYIFSDRVGMDDAAASELSSADRDAALASDLSVDDVPAVPGQHPFDSG